MLASTAVTDDNGNAVLLTPKELATRNDKARTSAATFQTSLCHRNHIGQNVFSRDPTTQNQLSDSVSPPGNVGVGDTNRKPGMVHASFQTRASGSSVSHIILVQFRFVFPFLLSNIPNEQRKYTHNCSSFRETTVCTEPTTNFDFCS